MEGSTVAAVALYLAIYILLLLLFIIGIFLIVCRCLRQSSRSNSVRSGVVGPTIVLYQTDGELPRGLEASVIESFPKFVFVYKDAQTNTDTDTYTKVTGECVVCLGAYEENETLRLVPKCGHVFHAECVDTWLRLHATCPFCRANLLPDSHPGEIPVRLEVLINGGGGNG